MESFSLISTNFDPVVSITNAFQSNNYTTFKKRLLSGKNELIYLIILGLPLNYLKYLRIQFHITILAL